MSLDLGLADGPDVHQAAFSVSFDNDAYYWFCFPFFETLGARTGQMIDLYGDAAFGGEHLEHFATTLAAIRSAAAKLPEVSSVCIGHQVVRDAAPEPLLAWLNRPRLLQLLDQLDALVEEAQREGKWVACLGD
jgi:hypothetical protein